MQRWLECAFTICIGKSLHSSQRQLVGLDLSTRQLTTRWCTYLPAFRQAEETTMSHALHNNTTAVKLQVQGRADQMPIAFVFRR